MNQIKQRRAVVRKKFLAHAKLLENTVLDENYPEEYLAENDLASLAKFDDLWNELVDIEEELLDLNVEIDDSSDQYLNRYAELLQRVRKVQKVVKTRASTCSEMSQPTKRDPFVEFNIGACPNCTGLPTLPKFSGVPDEWEMWWNRFDRKVWSNDHYETADQVDML